MAALASGAGDATCCALRQAALELDHAFQLRDDISDGSRMPAVFGKDRNKDIAKSTLVALLGPEGARLRLMQHLAAAHGQLRVALPLNEDVAQ